MTYSVLKEYLNDIDSLTSAAVFDGKTYVQPALKNLGSIAIPVIREVIAPASFRNADPEITDISVDGVRRVRAVSNKFKYGERSRGLQVLRFFKAGGAFAQNKTNLSERDAPGKAYDLNTMVFGDSANRGSKVLPVKAGVQYSDAISIMPYGACVDSTFHNRASEDGTLWDAAKGSNSNNLFERHFLTPGTLLLQVLTLNGRTSPVEALEHLLLSMGLAGAYGGQTSVYGINIRNHVVGVYAGRFERSLASPYEAVKALGLGKDAPAPSVDAVKASLDSLFSESYPVRVASDEVAKAQASAISSLEANDNAMAERYRASHQKVGAFFDAWFGAGAKA